MCLSNVKALSFHDVTKVSSSYLMHAFTASSSRSSIASTFLTTSPMTLCSRANHWQIPASFLYAPAAQHPIRPNLERMAWKQIFPSTGCITLHKMHKIHKWWILALLFHVSMHSSSFPGKIWAVLHVPAEARAPLAATINRRLALDSNAPLLDV